jgi:SAM-dependent methyltransferase
MAGSTPTPLSPTRNIGARARAFLQASVARLRRRLPRRIAGSTLALRLDLIGQGAAIRPRQPGPVWQSWANTVLQTSEDVDLAVREVAACGLAPHADRPKNWDRLVALGAILERFPRDAAILDAGSTLSSKLLPWLYLYGYRRLHGVDLTYENPIRRGPIRYERMDLTRTTFPDESFDAIACLSVIEHGVPLDAYVREATRLLRPGGLLITSTDFWCEPVSTGGQEAYGVPIKIFTPAEIEQCVALAAEAGLRLTGPLTLDCADRVVNWSRFGLDYTFVNFVLEKPRSTS